MKRALDLAAAILLGMCPATAFATAPGGPALVIEQGAVWKMGDYNQINLGVNLLNSGTFDPSHYSQTHFSGGGDLLVTGVPAFWHLLMETPGTVTLDMPSSCNSLVMSQGRLILSGGDFVADNIMSGNVSSWVVTPDTTKRLVCTATAAAPVTFPVGKSSWNAITLRPSLGSDQFRVAVVDAPPGGGFPPGNGVNRAWLVRQSNAPGADGTIQMIMEWSPGQEGPGFNGPGALAYQWANGGWTPRPGVHHGERATFPRADTLLTSDVGYWTLATPGTTDAGELEGTPSGVELAPVAPNPCVRAGVIRYGLPKSGHVTLAVYDVAGHRIATLADGEQRAGWHEATFDASRIPAGIYFGRLAAAGRTHSTKWIVVR